MTDGREQRIGIALGAGGANGLAHIAVLEAFDEAGIRPCHIAASSIGAVIGTLYAAGIDARDIRELVGDLVARRSDRWQQRLASRKSFRWLRFLDPVVGKGGFLKSDAFLGWLLETTGKSRFEELDIPLSVVATDFWQGRQKVFSSGELRPAIQSSIALPGLFTPSRVNGSVLVDGGAVNPVPFDVLPDDCTATLAIDVSGKRTEKAELSVTDTVFQTLQIMQRTIMAEKLKRIEPDLYLRAEIRDVRTLEFYKFDAVLEQAQPTREQVRQWLDDLPGQVSLL